MSNSLEVVLKLKDQFTAGMASATSTLNRSVKSASVSAKAFNSAFKEGERITKALRTPTEIYNDQVKRLTQLLNLGAVSQDTFNRGIAKAKSELDKSNSALNTHSVTTDKAQKSLLTLGNAYKAIASYLGVKIIKDFYDSANAIQAMQMKMNAAIPSLRGGQIEMAFIRKEANRMGLDLKRTASEYASFAAAALRSNITLSDTRKIFTDINEAAISMRLSNEKISYVMQALTQIASKGKVSMEELRLQLGDHLPGAVNIAAKAMGMTSEAFQKAVKDGTIMAEDFLPKFAEQIKKDLGGSFEDASNNMIANVNRMNNALLDLKAQVGKLFTSSLAATLVEDFTAFLEIANNLLGANEKLSKAQENILSIQQKLKPEEQKESLKGLMQQEKERIELLSKQRAELEQIQRLAEGRSSWGDSQSAIRIGRINELVKQINEATEAYNLYKAAMSNIGVGGGGKDYDGAVELSDKAQKDFLKRIREEAYEDARVRFETQQKAAKQLIEASRKWGYEDAKARIEAKKLYDEQMLSSEMVLQEARYSLMAEGYNKELALLDIKYQEIRIKHKNNADALYNIDEAYELEKRKLQKENSKQGLDVIANNLRTMSGQWKGFMRAYQIMAAAQAMIDAKSAANASYKAMAGIPYVGPILGAAAAATAISAGLAQVASIKSVKFATGTKDFITNGPMLMMVGDNRGGRERVNVQPLSSPNVNGPSGGTPAIFNFYDQSGSLVETVRREIRSGVADDMVKDLFNRYGYLK